MSTSTEESLKNKIANDKSLPTMRISIILQKIEEIEKRYMENGSAYISITNDLVRSKVMEYYKTLGYAVSEERSYISVK